MKIRSKKTSRIVKRALAFVMSFALAISTFAVSPSVDAASKKKPKLSVKKKTLYYNKSGKKSYTLKVKKAKKVKKITKTTWKTNNKSVVKISKKKKTSVKLTAKKAGKATITAKVRYTVKGSKKVKKKTLKCKVTSKKWTKKPTPTSTGTLKTAAPTPTNSTKTAAPSPTGTNTAAPAPTPTGNISTNTATPTPAGTTPTPAPAADKVVIEKPEATTIGTNSGSNELNLSAKVYDQYGAEMSGQAITWRSNDETVATVNNGKVTGIKDGAALIYATVGDVESAASASIMVLVDGTAPVIAKSEVSDYQTITVSLNEAITAGADAKIEVFKDASKTAETGITAELSEDGTSLAVKKNSFAAGSYQVVLTGYMDKHGNKFADGTNSATVVKAASVVAKFMKDDTKTVPARGAGNETKVYYKVQDQYGQTADFAMSGYTISVEAAVKDTGLILNNTTATDPGEGTQGYVTLPANSALVKDKTVSIKLTCTKDAVGQTPAEKVAEDTLEIVLADSTGFDTPTAFEKITATAVDAGDVASGSKADAPIFKNSVKDNGGFKITSTLLNSFGYNEASGAVKYVIDDTSVLAFAGDAKTVTAGNSTATAVTVKKAGTATITATLDSNADVTAKLTIQVLNPALTSIAVADANLTGATNNEEKTAAVTLQPAGTTLTGADLQAVLVSETEKGSVKTLEIKDDVAEGVTTTNVHIAAKANGKTNTIKFVVTNGTKDDLETDAQGNIKLNGSGAATVKTASANNGIVVSDVKTFASAPSDEVAADGLTLTAFSAKDGALTVGDTAELTYTLKNKYGEDITGLRANTEVKVNSADTTLATAAHKNGALGTITVTGVEAGNTAVNAQYGTQAVKTVDIKIDAAKKIKKITLSSDDTSYILGDADGVVVKISAESQYEGVPYKLTNADFTGNITMTATDLKVTMHALGNDGKPVAAAAGAGDEIKALIITNADAVTSVDKDTEKEIKLVKKGTGDFSDVTQKITLRPARANKTMAVSVNSLTAVLDTDSSETILKLTDQYGKEFKVAKTADIKNVVKVKDNDGKFTDSSDAVVTVGDYADAKKGYPVTVKAERVAGEYQITLFTGGSTPTETDPQTTFTFTAGETASLVKSIEFTGFVGDKELSKVDYIKVSSNTEVKPKLLAKDANGNVIAGVDEDVTGVIWYYTPSADFTASADNNTVTASAAEKTGTVKIKATYDKAEAEIIVPVSNTASKAKAGTYKIYVDGDAKKTNVSGGSTHFNGETGKVTLVVEATDQYGDALPIESFYGIDSADTAFATVAETTDTNDNDKIKIEVTKVANTERTKADIHIFVTETQKFTVTVSNVADLPIELTDKNCSGLSANVTVKNGVATLVTTSQWNASAKITVELPEGTSITDYKQLTFKIQAVGQKLTAPDGYGKQIQMDMQHKDCNELKGVGCTHETGDGDNKVKVYDTVTVGTTGSKWYVTGDNNQEITPETSLSVSINLDWTNKANIKESALTGKTVEFAFGINGLGQGDSYTISDLTLKG